MILMSAGNYKQHLIYFSPCACEDVIRRHEAQAFKLISDNCWMLLDTRMDHWGDMRLLPTYLIITCLLIVSCGIESEQMMLFIFYTGYDDLGDDSQIQDFVKILDDKARKQEKDVAECKVIRFQWLEPFFFFLIFFY